MDAPEPLCFKCQKKINSRAALPMGLSPSEPVLPATIRMAGMFPGCCGLRARRCVWDATQDMRARFTNAQFRHKPAVTQCLDCHSPHMSDQRYLLKTAAPGLCGKCHEKIVKDYQTAAVKHSPVTEESACMNCHDPHMAQESSLLLADGLDICLKCHDKTVKAGQTGILPI